MLLVRNGTREITRLDPKFLDLFEILNYDQRPSLESQWTDLTNISIFLLAHGAALTDLFYLPLLTSKCMVIEMQPLGFRKWNFYNINRLLEVSLETSHISNLEYHMWTSHKNEELPNLALDWNCLESKNMYRNQNFDLTGHNFRSISVLLSYWKREPIRFLMYMPWEQLNNQLLGLLNAMEICRLTNRILVLPPILHRRKKSRSRVQFHHADFEMKPYHHYMKIPDIDCIWLESILPMLKDVPALHFYHYNLYSSSNVTPAMVKSYYKRVIDKDLEIISTDWKPQMSSIPKELGDSERKNLSSASFSHVDILLLSQCFMFLDWDFPQTQYPLRKYHDYYTNSNAYRRNREELQVRSEISRIAVSIMAKYDFTGSVHYRRGDYFDKCKSESKLIDEEEYYFNRCYQNEEIVISSIEDKIRHRLESQNVDLCGKDISHNSKFSSESNFNYSHSCSSEIDNSRLRRWYLSTNEDSAKLAVLVKLAAQKGISVYTWEDVRFAEDIQPLIAVLETNGSKSRRPYRTSKRVVSFLGNLCLY